MSMLGNPLSVIDCETTGLGRRDRIVEIAIVTVDPQSGEVLDEFETLVNPERDVGPTDVHGVTAEMVELAPTFSEIAPVVASRLHHSTIVAHNLGFDRRMLTHEFGRIGSVVDWGIGICTLKLTGLKLAHAAKSLGIVLPNHHRALSDARTAASILRRLGDVWSTDACAFEGVDRREACRTLRREAFGECADVPLRRWILAACVPSSAEACVEYFDMLDHALSDFEFSAEEESELDIQREQMGLRASQVESMHHAYFESLRTAALLDGVVTQRERSILESVAAALGVSDALIPAITEVPHVALNGLNPGTRICFTGSATGQAGESISRQRLEEYAAARGMQPVPSVTKKGCELLVAASAASQSGKARKARDFGIPIIEVADFLRLIGITADAG